MSEMFEYDDQSSYESNFNTWYSMNSKERRDNHEEPYSRTVAERVFSEQYGRKSIKETISNLLKDR
jgi:hypothetical protein